MAKPILHLILATLQQSGREMHVSEIAHSSNLLQDQVVGSLHGYVRSDDAEVVRVKRGTYKWIGAPKVKTRTSVGSIKVDTPVETTVGTKSLRPAKSAEKTAAVERIPEMLEVLGHTKAGNLMARDPDTKQMYEAKPM